MQDVYGKIKRMKKIILFAFFLAIVQGLFAQNKVDIGINKKYLEFVDGYMIDVRRATPKQLKKIALRKSLKSIAKDRFNFSIGQQLYSRYQNLAIRFQSNTQSKVYEGNNWNWGNWAYLGSFIIDGNANVEFADVKITRETAKNYRYHVVTNDNKEIVGWTIPSEFKKTADGRTEYAYLGNYTSQRNGYLKIEIYNVNDYRERDAILVDWRPILRPKINLGVEYFEKKFSGGPFYTGLDVVKNTRFNNFIETTSLNDKKFFLGDSLVRLNVWFEGLNFSYRAQLIRKIKGNIETLDLGDYANKFFIYKEFWKKPGDYELILTPKLPSPGGTPIYYVKEKAASYKFTVLPEKNSAKLFSQKQLIIYGLILCAICGAIFGAAVTYIKKKEAQKLALKHRDKEMARLQLASVRSQLNPHFLFNALAGIQTLMNKNETDNANRYLSKFARLTRNVLENKDLISLTSEKTLLDDYLQMEQLRFGFQYTISASADLDAENIEIPAMLLQPFVENAVKHGVAEKGNLGKIEINFIKQETDLVLGITDNGTGFDSSTKYEGLGMALSKNRISLLNSIYKETPFVLDIQSGDEGTTVKITLTQWL
ncbi:Sensor histidine kinase YehU [compost metagenome]